MEVRVARLGHPHTWPGGGCTQFPARPQRATIDCVAAAAAAGRLATRGRSPPAVATLRSGGRIVLAALPADSVVPSSVAVACSSLALLSLLVSPTSRLQSSHTSSQAKASIFKHSVYFYTKVILITNSDNQKFILKVLIRFLSFYIR